VNSEGWRPCDHAEVAHSRIASASSSTKSCASSNWSSMSCCAESTGGPNRVMRLRNRSGSSSHVGRPRGPVARCRPRLASSAAPAARAPPWGHEPLLRSRSASCCLALHLVLVSDSFLAPNSRRRTFLTHCATPRLVRGIVRSAEKRCVVGAGQLQPLNLGISGHNTGHSPPPSAGRLAALWIFLRMTVKWQTVPRRPREVAAHASTDYLQNATNTAGVA
jgi:hypothetical protein